LQILVERIVKQKAEIATLKMEKVSLQQQACPEQEWVQSLMMECAVKNTQLQE